MDALPETIPALASAPTAPGAVRKFLAGFADNKHVNISALVSGGCELCAVWFPSYAPQFEATAKIAAGYLAGAAIAGK
jgi:hypothetical protein